MIETDDFNEDYLSESGISKATNMCETGHIELTPVSRDIVEDVKRIFDGSYAGEPMQLKRYAIIHKGEKTRWVILNNGDLDLTERFGEDCLMSRTEAEKWMENLKDERYELRLAIITISKP